MPTLIAYSTEPSLEATDAPPARQRVLIVDKSSECRDVLRAALERRGLEILEAPGAERGLVLAREFQPHVIVLDADSTARDDVRQAACEDAYEHNEASLVVLGEWRQGRTRQGSPRVVQKPYHFGPLVRMIEDLTRRRRVA